ncbi:MAG: M28 family peptidase [Holophagaceae bacterium]
MRPASVLLASLPALLSAQGLRPGPQPLVRAEALRAHLEFLSSDLLEGRGTGQRGGDLTVAYLETQARALGLQPVGGSYRQAVRIAGMKTRTAQSSLVFETPAGPLSPAFGEELVLGAGLPQASVAVDAPLVFVGYGIAAPEERWDDFKGLDLKGKVLVAMVNDPQPTGAEPDRFGGKSLTYYGRWTYKFEEAKRRGAAGILLIHTDASAAYGWSVVQNGWAHERFMLASGEGLSPLQGWMTDATARRLFAACGEDLDALRATAESRDFHPVVLKARAKAILQSDVRTVDQFNVAGLLPGSDPKVKDEVVIFSAHWDHLGKDDALVQQGKDGIFNGAVDNGSGTSALLAMAQAAQAARPRRSLLFLWVCAEEQGLLGSEAYAARPLVPLARTAAVLNLDSLNIGGLTADVGLAGAERTDLLALGSEAARAMGLKVAEARPDLGGGYFRSDHFSFAKAGVPAFSIGGGSQFVKDPEGAKARAEAYRKQRYHQVTDEFDPAWDFEAMARQAQFTLNLGLKVADAPAMPAWKPGEAFARAREASGTAK